MRGCLLGLRGGQVPGDRGQRRGGGLRSMCMREVLGGGRCHDVRDVLGLRGGQVRGGRGEWYGVRLHAMRDGQVL